MSQQTKWSQFAVLVSVFFFWGFVAASNDILIPVFHEKLHLEVWQSQWISFAFYVAYSVGSLIYFLVGLAAGGDVLNKLGYKNGIALGLIISALGTLLFYPAAETESFPLMISGLFVVGLGFSLQQTAANPLAIVMGNPKTGSQRLSMAGGINNFGTTIGPLIVSIAIFGSVGGAAKAADISAVKVPYLILGAAFILVAIIFKLSPIPNKIVLEDDSARVATPTDVAAPLFKKKSSAFQYGQLWLGMIGIFVYVGVEVATASNLPLFMKAHLKSADGLPFPTEKIAPYISLYWASLMMGRWTSSVGAFDISDRAKSILRFVMPYIAFAVFLGVNAIAGHDTSSFMVYAVVIIGLIIGDLLSRGNPARQLLIFSICGITGLVIGMLADGLVSVYAFISVGLFCSTLWPCIFTLAISGLGRFTNMGSSALIFMIMGGGVISMLQGVLASDDLLGIQASFIVGVLCFAYLAFYAIRAKVILKNQGIDFDKLESSGGH